MNVRRPEAKRPGPRPTACRRLTSPMCLRNRLPADKILSALGVEAVISYRATGTGADLDAIEEKLTNR